MDDFLQGTLIFQSEPTPELRSGVKPRDALWGANSSQEVASL